MFLSGLDGPSCSVGRRTAEKNLRLSKKLLALAIRDVTVDIVRVVNDVMQVIDRGRGRLSRVECDSHLADTVTCFRNDGLPMAEARRFDVESGQPVKGLDGPRPVLVEHAEHHRPDVGDRVTGEQQAVGRQMDCDAAFGMAGNLEDVRAAAEIENVAVAQFLIYCCRRRYGRQSGETRS